MAFEIKHGDCLEVMRGMADNSVDAVVTDPPYGLSFMGKKWDYDVPSEEVWRECLRVLKPGGHLLAFAGTRTQHRMAVRIEDAGFEIRDMIAWVYGSGFPKSLDVSKAIDKAAGAEREVLGYTANARPNRVGKETKLSGAQTIGGEITAPATEAARQWQGWGTALKPALEPITVARKPLIGTVAENVLQYGTGAINVDGGRVGTDDVILFNRKPEGLTISGWKENNRNPYQQSSQGRWPANLIHDGSDEVVGLFPDTGNSSGGKGAASDLIDNPSVYGAFSGANKGASAGGFGGAGSAARFFYCAKASKFDRGKGNRHPTVKPTELMRYLVRLVTQPGGTVLDPFTGSGSTGKAAVLEGFEFIGIEREAEYVAIAEARIAEAQRSLGLFA